MITMALRKVHIKPRGICPVCWNEVALMKNGTIGSWHHPCPGAHELPTALVERRVIPLPKA